KEFNMLPPGDIRNCMVALSEDEALLARLFQHRFATGTGLEGHSFGNLFLTALTSITGDFAEAVRHSSDILATRGRIFPATTAADHIRALFHHAGSKLFDYALINTAPLGPELKARYALEAASQIIVDEPAIRALGVEPVLGDYLDQTGTVARHAADRVAADLL